jgi:NAD(P)-dependent dehydrogenase (short-subunit alcohol dehydrogenase family)
MKSVVITGASSGIGWSAAKILIGNGYHVYGSVRKQEDAERLSGEFGKHFTPLFFDITDETAVHAAAKQVGGELNGETLFGLVNNAGVASPAPLIHQPIEEFRKQIEINVTGQLIVTQAFAPLLGVDRSKKGSPGRIINVGSVSGRNGSPFLGAYAASKHALEGMSESLRREMMLYDIKVIVVAPGPIATPIWDKAEQMDLSQYEKTEFFEAGMKVQRFAIRNGRNGLSAARVGEVIYQALTVSHPRVHYTITPNPFSTWIMSVLPKRFVDTLIAKNLGFHK